MEALSTELWMVILTSVWCVLLTLVLAVGRAVTPGGTAWATSNRHTLIDLPPWVQRAQRAHVTAIENVVPFAALVLIIHITGRSTDTTVTAAVVFAICRLTHSVSYVLGLVPWRTIIHSVGIGALLALLTAFIP
jgi:uncharacterized MAPEG superfamily protein